MHACRLLTLLVNSLTWAMATFLVAAGLTLVFGTLHILNFSHGGFFMIGAYAAYSLASAIGAATSIGAVPVRLAGRWRARRGARTGGRPPGAAAAGGCGGCVCPDRHLRAAAGLRRRDQAGVGPEVPQRDAAGKRSMVPGCMGNAVVPRAVAVHHRGGPACLRGTGSTSSTDTRAAAWSRPSPPTRGWRGCMGINVRRVYTATVALGFALAGLAGGLLRRQPDAVALACQRLRDLCLRRHHRRRHGQHQWRVLRLHPARASSTPSASGSCPDCRDCRSSRR